MKNNSIEFYGPFKPTYRIQAFGYEIPKIEALPEGDKMLITLDRRFGITCTTEEADRWMPFIAHAMAIASGFTCHGENSEKSNPYKVQVREIE